MTLLNNIARFMQCPVRYLFGKEMIDNTQSQKQTYIHERRASSKISPKLKEITTFYPDRPTDSQYLHAWYELLPIHMRVAKNYYELKKIPLIFNFKSEKDCSVTPSDLDKILNMVNSIIDIHVPEQFRESCKQDYIDIIVNYEASHLKLANETAKFLRQVLFPD